MLKKSLSLILFISLFIILSDSSLTLAMDRKPAYDSSQYTVQPVFGERQEKDVTGFYDMKVYPGDTDKFRLTITNNSTSKQTYQIDVNKATTNNNVLVSYTKPILKDNTSNLLDISKLISLDNHQITIPAHQSTQVNFKLKIPKRRFDGILLGGVVVRPITPVNQNDQIQNVFMHTIAIRIRQNDNNIVPTLKSGKIDIGQENLHNFVSMHINNPQPKLMTQIQGDFYITKQGSNQKIVEEHEKSLSIAPNSQFEIPIRLKNNFKPGQYKYIVQLKNNEGAWIFKKDFTISPKTADQYNKTSVDSVKKTNNSWLIRFLFIAIVFGFIIISYMINKKSKH